MPITDDKGVVIFAVPTAAPRTVCDPPMSATSVLRIIVNVPHSLLMPEVKEPKLECSNTRSRCIP